jgi:hypothetical protein
MQRTRAQKESLDFVTCGPYIYRLLPEVLFWINIEGLPSCRSGVATAS